MNLVYGLTLHEFSVAQVARAPAQCLGGHRFEPIRELSFSLCPTLVMLIISFSHLFHRAYETFFISFTYFMLWNG